MTSFYMKSPSFPHDLEGNQDHHLLFGTPASQSITSSYSIHFKVEEDQETHFQGNPQGPQQHKDETYMRNWTTGEQNIKPTSLHHHHLCYQNSSVKPSQVYKREDEYDGSSDNSNAPIKWMSSKMRLMRKMLNSEQRSANEFITDAQTSPNYMLRSRSCDYEQGNNSMNNVIRVCSDCNTTKTPLWRSGPRGPKSLCNACGIRQRKARRALAAAAMAQNEMVTINSSARKEKSKVPKEKRPKSHECTLQYKKQWKNNGPRPKKKLRLEDLIINLSKNSAFQRVFPQDERDAAILLMALSCGLVCS